MKPTDDIEGLLTQVPPPRLVEGPHRQLLKHQLLREHASGSLSPVRFRWKPVLAWAACAVLVFAIAQVLIQEWMWTVSSEPVEPYRALTLPNGDIVLSSDPDYSVAKAVALDEEVGDLIRQGKHELIKTIDLAEDGFVLVYQVVLSDGQVAFCTSVAPPASGGDKDTLWVRLARP